MWTIEKVKEELPDVQCRFGENAHTCRTAGRKNQFCTVWALDAHWLQAEFSWETVTRSLNNHSVLDAS